MKTEAKIIFATAVLFIAFGILSGAVIDLRASTLLFLDGRKGQDALSEESVCTMDAKVCPDGTFVGRVGPNCEFAKCPSITTLPIYDHGY